MSARQLFRDALVTAFTDDELSILCNDLGVDPEVIGGQTLGQEVYADRLITYFEKRGRVDELLGALRKTRPAIVWAYMPARVVEPRIKGLPRWGVFAAIALCAVIGGIVLLRSWLAPRTSSANATTTAGAPQVMPGKYNIVVAEVVQIQGSDVQTSTDGSRLSQHFSDRLKDEFANNITADARADLQAVIWDAADLRAHSWAPSTIASDADAAALATNIGADLVVYGRIEPEHAASNDLVLRLEYHQSRRNGLSEEIGGTYALGAPIPALLPMSNDMDTAIRLELNQRQKLLLRFALGALYDRLGRNTQALSVFRNMVTLSGGDSGSTGAAIAYLIGREHLLLRQSEAAQREFERALELDGDFVRAHLGLGDVHYQRMVSLPANQRLASPDLSQANMHYAQAETLASVRTDSNRLATIARLGLGLVALAEADAHSLADSIAESGDAAGEAVTLIEPSVRVLETDRGADPRTLAAAYLGLGNASTLAGLAAIGNDDETVRGMRARAQRSFAACVTLDVRTDPLLSADLTALCKKGLLDLETLLPE